MVTPIEASYDLRVGDWLNLLPASCLHQYLVSPAAHRLLSSLRPTVSVSALEDLIAHHEVRTGRRLKSYSELARAVSNLKRALRGREIRDVRPTRSNWVVPDTVGFSLEGKSRYLASRKSHISAALTNLACQPASAPVQRQALRRVSSLVAKSRSHPTWLYWYSPQTIALVRRSSHQTLIETNQLAAKTISDLGFRTTISSWEESIGIVSRRLPLHLVMACNPSSRCIQLIRKFERLGISTIGGLTIVSTDSMAFLNAVQLGTLEACSSALKDGRRRRAV